MALAEIELARIKKYVGSFCARRSPIHIRDKLSLEYLIKNQDVLIYERRPKWNDPTSTTESSVAKLRYVRKSNEWKLYWQRANMKWYAYEPFPSSNDLEKIVDVIDQDKYGCFFG